MAEDKFGSGSISNQGGFKYSTPQERFAKQLERDLEGRRKERRLSQSTLRKLITDDTAQWARNIYAEKTAKNAAINVLNTQNQSRQTLGVITEFGGGVGGDPQIAGGLTAPTTSSASSSPVEFPDGGGEEACVGLELSRRGNSVWIGAGTVNGILPDGFNAISGYPIASGGFGYVWIELTIEENYNGVEIKTVVAKKDTTLIEDNKPKIVLGYYNYLGNNIEISNYGCGSVWASFCRNWFVAEPPYFSVTFTRGA